MTTKVPAELSSTPGIADSSNATAITIDSSEQIGIGTTAPNDYDNNSAGISSNLVVKDSGHSGIIVISGTSSDAAIAFGDGTGTDAYRGALAYVNSADALYFKAAGANKLRLDSDGLKFGSDTAAANALDDYEEGTWTPQITASAGSAGTAAYSNQMGRYTKIGNKVFFEFQVVMTNKGSWSAYTRVLGFPFTVNSTGLISFAVSRFPDDTIGANMIGGELQPSSTYCFFTTGSRLDSLHNISNIDTGYYLTGAGHYTI